VSEHVEFIKNLGSLHPVHVRAVVEQVVQGEAHLSHFEVELFPYCPEGQFEEQLEAERKVGETQAVHVVMEVEHFMQGGVQGLQVQSRESPIY
jgi:hypothetical protein